jgi:hypothetical protein
VGSKVLTRGDGRVGFVVHAPAAPEDTYRVRFADGQEAGYRRNELTIFKHTDAEIPGGPDAAALQCFVIFRCIVGSTAYGLNLEDSDVDQRGFYLPPAELQWGLAGVPEQLETGHEECYWEVEKFIRLGLKANPNILECLYSPLVETCTPLAAELIEMRHAFLSRHVHRTYNSYVLSQFKKLEQDLRNQQGVRWKHVMHLIRLLLSGVAVLKHGFVPLRVDGHREQLLAIRRGEVPWEQVEAWRLGLHSELDRMLESIRLPATTITSVATYNAEGAGLIGARSVKLGLLWGLVTLYLTLPRLYGVAFGGVRTLHRSVERGGRQSGNKAKSQCNSEIAHLCLS